MRRSVDLHLFKASFMTHSCSPSTMIVLGGMSMLGMISVSFGQLGKNFKRCRSSRDVSTVNRRPVKKINSSFCSSVTFHI